MLLIFINITRKRSNLREVGFQTSNLQSVKIDVCGIHEYLTTCVILGLISSSCKLLHWLASVFGLSFGLTNPSYYLSATLIMTSSDSLCWRSQPGEGAFDLTVRFKRLTNYVFVGFLTNYCTRSSLRGHIWLLFFRLHFFLLQVGYFHTFSWQGLSCVLQAIVQLVGVLTTELVAINTKGGES